MPTVAEALKYQACRHCGRNLALCRCPDANDQLKALLGRRVYVAEIIQDRIKAGLSTEADFAGVNVNSPWRMAMPRLKS